MWLIYSTSPTINYFLEKAFQPDLGDPKHQLIFKIQDLFISTHFNMGKDV